MNDLKEIGETLGISLDHIEYVYLDTDYDDIEQRRAVYVMKDGSEVSFAPNDFRDMILSKYTHRQAEQFCLMLLKNIPHDTKRRELIS